MVWASKRVNRPIKWTAERSEAFLSDAHGRDHVTHAELALDKDGKFLAMRVHTTANMGAYLSTFASCIPTILYATLLAGQYTTPAIYCEVTAVVHQHRAGRRVSRRRAAGGDLRRRAPRAPGGASTLGIAQDEIRRRNFIRTFPYQTPVALHLRHRRLRRDARRGDEDGRRRRASRRARPRRRSAASCAASATRRTSRPAASRRRTSPARSARARACSRRARCACNPTGSVTVFTGSHSHGQGHETTFAQVVAARLGIPIENVDIVHGDTGRVPFGMGTYGSRSLAVGGTAIVKALDKVDRQGQEDRRAPARGGGGRHRVQGRQVHRRRHRPQQGVRRGRARRVRAAQLSARQARAGPRTRRRSTIRPTSPSRPARTSARSRSIRTPAWCRSSTSRACDDFGNIINPMIVEGPGARRPRAGHRPGAARELRLRQGQRPAADRQLHGLRDAARRRRAVVQGRAPRSRRARTIRSAPRAAARRARSARRRR